MNEYFCCQKPKKYSNVYIAIELNAWFNYPLLLNIKQIVFIKIFNLKFFF